MMLLIHISIAITSVILATVALVRPSQQKLRATTALVAATLATGTYLVVASHSPLLSACLSGLFYVSVVMTLMLVAQYRLAKATQRSR